MEIELRRISVHDNRGRAGGWPHTPIARSKVHRSLETMSFVRLGQYSVLVGNDRKVVARVRSYCSARLSGLLTARYW